MERTCSQCHAVIAQDAAVCCPACGGTLLRRQPIPGNEPANQGHEVDLRGIVLPRRHALGGIITPQ